MDSFSQQWAIASSAPGVIIPILLAGFAAIWAFLHFFYSEVLKNSKRNIEELTTTLKIQEKKIDQLPADQLKPIKNDHISVGYEKLSVIYDVEFRSRSNFEDLGEKNVFYINFKTKITTSRIRVFLRISYQWMQQPATVMPRILIASFEDVYNEKSLTVSFGEMEIDRTAKCAKLFWTSVKDNFPVIGGLNFIQLIWADDNGIEDSIIYGAQIITDNAELTNTLSSSKKNCLVELVPEEIIAARLKLMNN